MPISQKAAAIARISRVPEPYALEAGTITTRGFQGERRYIPTVVIVDGDDYREVVHVAPSLMNKTAAIMTAAATIRAARAPVAV